MSEQGHFYSRLCGIVIDCQDGDLAQASAFWSGALGRPLAEIEGKYAKLATRPGEQMILLQVVTHPNRVHLDIESDDVEREVARLEALGARRLENIRTWWVMEAPTGHRFCVVRPQRGPLGPESNAWPAPPPAQAPRPAEQVREVLGRFSAAWQARRFGELEALIHPDCVFVKPGFTGRVAGRAACVESLREFMARCRVERYQESEHAVEVAANAATATYRWSMRWVDGGEALEAEGRDLLTLARQDGRWQIAWRTMV